MTNHLKSIHAFVSHAYLHRVIYLEIIEVALNFSLFVTMFSETQDVNIFSIRQEDKTLGILLSSKIFFLMHQLLEMTTFLSLSFTLFFMG